MEKEKYEVIIESFAYFYCAGQYSLNIQIDASNNTDNLKLQSLFFTREQYDEFTKDEKLDYGFVNSICIENDKYVLKKISRTMTYNIEMTKYPYDIV